MKAYIFITMAISGIGGASQYLYNKINYLKNHGYKVYVFSGLDREILISDFVDYKDQIIPAVMYAPGIFSKKEVNYTIERMCLVLGSIDRESIIESTSIEAAQWGELLAQKLNVKNFIFNLQEKHCYSPSEISFLKFKLNRKELAGITQSAVSKMIKEPNLQFKPFMAFSAPCNNVVQDIPCSICDALPDARLTIGSIGRLEKEFLYIVLEQLKIFFDDNPTDKFNLLLIGGSTKKVISRIKHLFKDTSNVNLIITGYIYPIPKKLLLNVDIFISTAGSALVSFNYNRPTLKAHPFTGEILGVLGNSLDARSSDFLANDYVSLDLISAINNIERGQLEISYEEYDDSIEFDRAKKEFDRELSIELGSSKEIEYYNINSIKSLKSIKYYFYKSLAKSFGGDRFQRIIEKMRFIFS